MSRVNPRLAYWLARLYDKHEPPLTSVHRAILTCLATRHLDYSDGRGSCSNEQLMADNGAAEATVRSALTRARKLGMLQRTKRGHRTGDGLSIASEWALVYPPLSTAQEKRVDEFSTAQKPGSQPLRRDGPTEKKQKRRASARQAAPRPRRCAMCRSGDHEHCTGRGCTCAPAHLEAAS